MHADIVGLSFAVEPGAAAYVPLAHDYAGAPEQLARDACWPRSSRCSKANSPRRSATTSSTTRTYSSASGIELRGMRFDSMLESYVWNSTATRHDIDRARAQVSRRRYDCSYEYLTGKGAKQIAFSQVAVDAATQYAAERSGRRAATARSAVAEDRQRCRRCSTLYETIEQPLEPVLLRMEQTRRADRRRAAASSRAIELAARMRELEAQAHAAAGGPFSLESPKQLQEVLFGKLGLPVMRKTPTGQPSTAEDVLEELAEKYELPRMIMEYRELAKLKSTYTDKLPLQINRATGRVHTYVSPSRRRDGPTVVDRSEPAEHSDPHARRAAHPQAFVAPAGLVHRRG